MANITVTSNSATHFVSSGAASLSNSDTINSILVATGGLVINTGTATALRLNATTGTHNIVIHGDVRGTGGEAIGLVPSATVTVAEGGLLSSNGGGIVAVRNLTLHNAGTIGAGLKAVSITGDFGQIVNTGDILTTSTSEAAIHFEGAPLVPALNTIFNTGLISTFSTNAILADLSSAGMHITNLGQIAGGITSTSTQTLDTVINSGLITGAVNLGGGADTYDGRGGGFVSGTIDLGANDDTFFGGSLAEFVTSSSGNDTFDFGGGNDTFTASAGDGNDTVDGGDGIDTLDFSALASLSFIDLATGAASAAGSIDSISNFENIRATNGADQLIGNGASNRIEAFLGNDILNGRGAGADVLDGGADNDTYVIDAGDRIIDASGTDLVQSSAISLNLASLGGGQIENAQLLGSANLNLTGNGGANVLTGNVGKNTLTGGLDDDTFVFNTRLSSARTDIITDFNRIDDVMHLENTGSGLFTGLADGALAGAFFKSNATGTATDADDRIVYNRTTGDLFFDKNGSGAGGAIKFATLSNKAVITAADFFII